MAVTPVVCLIVGNAHSHATHQHIARVMVYPVQLLAEAALMGGGKQWILHLLSCMPWTCQVNQAIVLQIQLRLCPCRPTLTPPLTPVTHVPPLTLALLNSYNTKGPSTSPFSTIQFHLLVPHHSHAHFSLWNTSLLCSFHLCK